MEPSLIVESIDINFKFKKDSTMKKLPLLVFLFIGLFWGTIPLAKADSWIDEDGDSIVIVEDTVISIYSLNSFYYFDEIFSNLRKNDKKIRVCFGFDANGETGRPADCIKDLAANYSIHNHGKNRAIHVDISSFPFLISAFEDYLKAGRTMRISLDDDDLYAVYILNKTHALTKESKDVLALTD
jgi:hypothetical protein